MIIPGGLGSEIGAGAEISRLWSLRPNGGPRMFGLWARNFSFLPRTVTKVQNSHQSRPKSTLDARQTPLLKHLDPWGSRQCQTKTKL